MANLIAAQSALPLSALGCTLIRRSSRRRRLFARDVLVLLHDANRHASASLTPVATRPAGQEWLLRADAELGFAWPHAGAIGQDERLQATP